MTSAANNQLVVQQSDDVFAIISGWPYHLLDGVAASSIRTYASEAQYVVGQLASGQIVDSFTVTATIDNLRRIISWIKTNKDGGVTFEKMDDVSAELQQLQATLEKVYNEIIKMERSRTGGNLDQLGEIDG